MKLFNLILLYFFSNAVAIADARTQILHVSEIFHGDEVKAKSGEEWFALDGTGETFELRKVKLKITAVHDEVVDSKLSQKTGKKVEVIPQSRSSNILLIKSDGNLVLKEGKVAGKKFDQAFIYPGMSEYFSVADKTFQMVGLGEARQERDSYLPVISHYSIQLIYNKVFQTIFSSKKNLGFEGRPTLIWEGDLDQDGKLDLLMNLTDHYNKSQLTLFLSSSAKDGELVGIAAEFVTVGC